jgi:hypothetical protein
MTLSEVRTLVGDYLHCSITRSDFTMRFAEAFYGVEKSHDEEAIEFCYAVDSRIAEASAGLITEDVLRESLASYISSAKVTIKTVTVTASYQKSLFPKTEAIALYPSSDVELVGA